MVEEAEQPGGSISSVARKYEVHPNQLFNRIPDISLSSGRSLMRGPLMGIEELLHSLTAISESTMNLW